MEHGILTATARLWLGEDGVIRERTFPGAEETAAEARRNLAAIAGLSGGQPRPLLIDLRGLRWINREARQQYVGDGATGSVSALALLADSPVSRVFATFFLGLERPPYPARMFDQESEAIEWLKKQST